MGGDGRGLKSKKERGSKKTPAVPEVNEPVKVKTLKKDTPKKDMSFNSGGSGDEYGDDDFEDYGDDDFEEDDGSPVKTVKKVVEKEEAKVRTSFGTSTSEYDDTTLDSL